MTENEMTAKLYFDALHAGRLDEVVSYFSEHGVVTYGTEPSKPANDFFRQTKDLISQVRFKTRGIYTSRATRCVLIHFSFTMPPEGGTSKPIEAIEIIECNDKNKIQKVTVIPNG